MKLLLLAVVVIVGVLVVLSLLRKGTGAGPVGSRPPGTRHLDEETAVRPDIDPQALAAARAQVAPTVPDAVLSDALLDATPKQVAHLFSAVPADVMANAMGQNTGRGGTVQVQGQATAQDMAQLRNLSSAVDELDIWNFGDDTGHKA
ncbi:hypothetical protein [Deinococcus sp. PESE-13]